jgi:hypothetical protein
MITKLKYILIKYFPAVIFFIVKNYIGLDFINDFNPFTSETKEFFNGNSGNEGEGSNRQNNPQDSSINPPSTSTSSEEGGVVVSGEELEQVKALYENNSEFFGQMDTELDAIVKGDAEKKRLIEEGVRIIEERKAEMKQRIIDFEGLKNQGQSEESLSDIKRELVEDAKALYEDYKKLSDKAHTHKAEVNKLCLELILKSTQKIKDSINESNSK